MSSSEIPSNFQEENSQQLESIISALELISVAVSALPGANLQIGNLETGPAATLSVSPATGLEIKYKPAQSELVYPTKDHSLTPKVERKQKNTGTSREASSKKENEARVTLTGRLAYEPSFKKTAKGIVARFGIAVPDETLEKKVRYEQIYTTGEYAEKLQEAGLHKGATVQIVWYEQYRQSKSKTGSEKLEKQIYSVAVKPIGNKNPSK
jgi:hypothetical protein